MYDSAGALTTAINPQFGQNQTLTLGTYLQITNPFTTNDAKGSHDITVDYSLY